MRVKWKMVVDIVKEEIIPYFEREGVKPTLRTIFYALVSRNIIPNTKSSYQRLSRVLVEARKEGIFAWDFIEDRTRYVLKNFSDYELDEKDVEYVEKRCKEKVEEIDIHKLIEEWFDWLKVSPHVGYWAEQPIVPEIWIEKDALAPTIDNWTKDLSVNVRVNRGYSSWTFIYENVKELRNLLNEHEKVVILYCGDLDPSGVDIQRFLKEALEYFGMDESKVELVRVAVTPEQVDKFGLPPKPEDAETLAKLQRDPRTKRYTYDYVVELDSLVAYAPNEFKQLLREAIEKLHDKDIYGRVKKKAKDIAKRIEDIVEKAKKEAIEKIKNSL